MLKAKLSSHSFIFPTTRTKLSVPSVPLCTKQTHEEIIRKEKWKNVSNPNSNLRWFNICCRNLPCTHLLLCVYYGEYLHICEKKAQDLAFRWWWYSILFDQRNLWDEKYYFKLLNRFGCNFHHDEAYAYSIGAPWRRLFIFLFPRALMMHEKSSEHVLEASRKAPFW